MTKKAPYKGLGADSVEKHEPASDIEPAVARRLKALDPNRPIREADSCTAAILSLSINPVGGQARHGKAECLSGFRLAAVKYA